MDLCDRATWRPGVRVSWRWWEQSGIDLGGANKWAAETTRILETDSEEESEVELNGDSGGEEEYQGKSRSSGAEWRGLEDG